MDLIHELPYGPAACEPPQQRPDTWQHPIQRRSCSKILLAPEGASTQAFGRCSPATWPALLAAISDVQGTIVGVHRTWLDRSGLAVRVALPRVPAVAGLSAHHLAVLELPPGVKRLLHCPRWRRRGHPGGKRYANGRTRPASLRGLCIAKQKCRDRRPPLRSGPWSTPQRERRGGPSCGVPARPAPGFPVATKAAAVAAFPNREPTMLDETASSPSIETNDAYGASAPTHPLDELVLYAHRPFQDDSDSRPLPEPEEADTAIVGAMNAITDLLTGTRLEDDLPDLLWSYVNLFHRHTDRISRQLDDNEQQQRRSQTEQDGTEVKASSWSA